MSTATRQDTIPEARPGAPITARGWNAIVRRTADLARGSLPITDGGEHMPQFQRFEVVIEKLTHIECQMPLGSSNIIAVAKPDGMETVGYVKGDQLIAVRNILSDAAIWRDF